MSGYLNVVFLHTHLQACMVLSHPLLKPAVVIGPPGDSSAVEVHLWPHGLSHSWFSFSREGIMMLIEVVISRPPLGQLWPINYTSPVPLFCTAGHNANMHYRGWVLGKMDKQRYKSLRVMLLKHNVGLEFHTMSFLFFYFSFCNWCTVVVVSLITAPVSKGYVCTDDPTRRVRNTKHFFIFFYSFS